MQRALILGIGAQRAGSTWLFDYLVRHPQVFTSPVKELHFFDAYFLPQMRAKWQERVATQIQRLERRARRGVKRIPVLQAWQQWHDDPIGYFRYFAELAGEKQFVCECSPSYALLTR